MSKENKRMLSSEELSFFTGQVAVMLQSGIPLYESIEVLAENYKGTQHEAAFKLIYEATDRGEQLIPFHEILYAERSLRGMTVHLTNDRMVESVTLRSSFRNAVSELLKDDRFYLAGASILLNLDHVRGLKQECVLLADETSLIVPKRYFSDLRMTWIRHWGAMDPSENKQD